jgi:hypothetical protein
LGCAADVGVRSDGGTHTRAHRERHASVTLEAFGGPPDSVLIAFFLMIL